MIMAAIFFDTHKFIQTLQEAGFDQKQAEAVSQAFKEATGEAEVATKRDLEKLEAKMETRFERLDGKLTLIQWILALVVAAEVVPLLATLFK
jgi:hypothetical protein